MWRLFRSGMLGTRRWGMLSLICRLGFPPSRRVLTTGRALNSLIAWLRPDRHGAPDLVVSYHSCFRHPEHDRWMKNAAFYQHQPITQMGSTTVEAAPGSNWLWFRKTSSRLCFAHSTSALQYRTRSMPRSVPNLFSFAGLDWVCEMKELSLDVFHAGSTLHRGSTSHSCGHHWEGI